MARRSLNCVGAEDGDEIGCKPTGSAAGNRAHLHMPRCRKMLSPLRASAGSGSPSMAERSLS
jgi:hypothetical protein